MTSHEPLDTAVMDFPTSQTPVSPLAPPPLPTQVSLNELQRESTARLGELAAQLGVRNQPPRSRHALVCEMVRAYLARGVRVTADGILELGTDTFGLLRWPEYNFLPCPEDLYVPANLIKQYGLRAGQRLVGTLRPARDKEKYTALDRLLTVEGRARRPVEGPQTFRPAHADVPGPAHHPGMRGLHQPPRPAPSTSSPRWVGVSAASSSPRHASARR